MTHYIDRIRGHVGAQVVDSIACGIQASCVDQAADQVGDKVRAYAWDLAEQVGSLVREAIWERIRSSDVPGNQVVA